MPMVVPNQPHRAGPISPGSPGEQLCRRLDQRSEHTLPVASRPGHRRRAPRPRRELPAGAGRTGDHRPSHRSRHGDHARSDGISRPPRRQRGCATGRTGRRRFSDRRGSAVGEVGEPVTSSVAHSPAVGRNSMSRSWPSCSRGFPPVRLDAPARPQRPGNRLAGSLRPWWISSRRRNLPGASL
jgi:hypothetical protein